MVQKQPHPAAGSVVLWNMVRVARSSGMGCAPDCRLSDVLALLSRSLAVAVSCAPTRPAVAVDAVAVTRVSRCRCVCAGAESAGTPRYARAAHEAHVDAAPPAQHLRRGARGPWEDQSHGQPHREQRAAARAQRRPRPLHGLNVRVIVCVASACVRGSVPQGSPSSPRVTPSCSLSLPPTPRRLSHTRVDLATAHTRVAHACEHDATVRGGRRVSCVCTCPAERTSRSAASR
jgi:hypothetical protein